MAGWQSRCGLHARRKLHLTKQGGGGAGMQPSMTAGKLAPACRCWVAECVQLQLQHRACIKPGLAL